MSSSLPPRAPAAPLTPVRARSPRRPSSPCSAISIRTSSCASSSAALCGRMASPPAAPRPLRSRQLQGPAERPLGEREPREPWVPQPGRRPRWSKVCLGTWDVTVPSFELVTGTGPQRRTLLWPGNRCEQPTPFSSAMLGPGRPLLPSVLAAPSSRKDQGPGPPSGLS